MTQGNSQRRGLGQEMLAWAMTLAMVLNLFPAVGIQEARADDTAGQSAQSVTVANPRIEPVSSIISGKKVTWDCLWLGSYPQTEVAESEALLAATWDDNGDAIVDGVKYRRITRKDVITYSTWPERVGTYRYFRYDPIKWRVLSVDQAASTAFCLADVGLDAQMYNATNTAITWEKSSIRSWLNGYAASENFSAIDYGSKNFIDSAFSEREQASIIESSILNSNNLEYDWVPGGNQTKDRLILLSDSDVYGGTQVGFATTYGFISTYSNWDNARRCTLTDFTHAMGVHTNTIDLSNIPGDFPWEAYGHPYNDLCDWWLRTPGEESDRAVVVDRLGEVQRQGELVYNEFKNSYGTYTLIPNAVRPAMNVDLTSLELRYAGTVATDGTVDEKPYETPKADISSATVSIQGSFTYNGEAHTPKPTVILNENTLTEGVDYTLSYKDNVNAGTATVTVTGKGIFKGSKDVTFTIKKARISKVELSQRSFAYDGTEKKPELTVYAGTSDELVVPEGGFEAIYSNNINVGNEAMVLVKAKEEGNFTGQTYETFEIVDSGTGGEEQTAPYKVELYYMKAYGVWPTKPQKTLNLTGTVDQEVSFNVADGTTYNNKKYAKSKYKIKSTVTKGTVAADGSLTLKVYYDFASGSDPCFWDVDHNNDDHWFAGVVHDVNDMGLITGYEEPIKRVNGKNLKPFGPKDKITRAQIVVILWRMAGQPTAKSKTNFKDVKQYNAQGKENYYWMATLWAKEQGISDGYTSGKRKGEFGFNDHVTREQLAGFLGKYSRIIANKNVAGSESDYSKMKDKGDVSNNMKTVLGWCFKNGIISGTNDLRIKPKDTATRGEAAKMFKYFYDLLNKE